VCHSAYSNRAKFDAQTEQRCHRVYALAQRSLISRLLHTLRKENAARFQAASSPIYETVISR
jgi:hypothetical protein